MNAGYSEPVPYPASVFLFPFYSIQKMKGIVFDIRRFSVNDGPGIRTTVFMKGCPLRCLWCHNPESQEGGIAFHEKTRTMANVAKTVTEQVGKEMSVDEVMGEILKDVVFYEESGGGVTFSGGEPLYQPQFLRALLAACKIRGIKTAVDTCGHADPKNFDEIINLTDLFLFDLKHPDSGRHLNYTGSDNEMIRKNLRLLIRYGANVIIRIPVIPGINDQPETMRQFADALKGTGITKIHLLPYHSMAKTKYARLKRNNPFTPPKQQHQSNMNDLKKIFTNEGFITQIGG